MDIQINKDIYSNLKEFNDNRGDNYGNKVLEAVPKNKIYPYTVFQTVRDVADTRYNTPFDRVSNKGYRIDIYAQDKGQILRKDIAEQISKIVDFYLSNYYKLTRASFNAIDLENEGTVYHIIMMYSGNLHENRRKFI